MPSNQHHHHHHSQVADTKAAPLSVKKTLYDLWTLYRSYLNFSTDNRQHMFWLIGLILLNLSLALCIYWINTSFMALMAIMNLSVITYTIFFKGVFQLLFSVLLYGLTRTLSFNLGDWIADALTERRHTDMKVSLKKTLSFYPHIMHTYDVTADKIIEHAQDPEAIKHLLEKCPGLSAQQQERILNIAATIPVEKQKETSSKDLSSYKKRIKEVLCEKSSDPMSIEKTMKHGQADTLRHFFWAFNAWLTTHVEGGVAAFQLYLLSSPAVFTLFSIPIYIPCYILVAVLVYALVYNSLFEYMTRGYQQAQKDQDNAREEVNKLGHTLLRQSREIGLEKKQDLAIEKLNHLDKEETKRSHAFLHLDKIVTFMQDVNLQISAAMGVILSAPMIIAKQISSVSLLMIGELFSRVAKVLSFMRDNKQGVSTVQTGVAALISADQTLKKLKAIAEKQRAKIEYKPDEHWYMHADNPASISREKTEGAQRVILKIPKGFKYYLNHPEQDGKNCNIVSEDIYLCENDRVEIQGPNGCGKSVLFQVFQDIWPYSAPEREKDPEAPSGKITFYCQEEDFTIVPQKMTTFDDESDTIYQLYMDDLGSSHGQEIKKRSEEIKQALRAQPPTKKRLNSLKEKLKILEENAAKAIITQLQTLSKKIKEGQKEAGIANPLENTTISGLIHKIHHGAWKKTLIRDLSGGERQILKVAILSLKALHASSNRHSIIALDEYSSAVDRHIAPHLPCLFEDKKVTILVIHHAATQMEKNTDLAGEEAPHFNKTIQFSTPSDKGESAPKALGHEIVMHTRAVG